MSDSEDKDAQDNVIIEVPQFMGPHGPRRTRPKKKHGPPPHKEMDKSKRGDRVVVRPGKRQKELWDPNFDFSTLDDEELVRGRRRDKHGDFRGRPPAALPAAFHRRAMMELFKRADDQLRINLVECTTHLTTIAGDPEVDPAVRARVAEWVIERVMGKTPEIVTVTKGDPWDAVLEGVIADADEDMITKARAKLAEGGG